MDDVTLNDFLEFEADEKLFEQKYRGIYYWQAIRNYIIEIVFELSVEESATKEIADNGTAKENKLTIRKWIIDKFKLFNEAKCDIKNWHKLKKADILYFDQQSYRTIHGKKADPYFDYFHFEQKYSIQYCFYYNHGTIKDYIGKGVGTLLPALILLLLKRFSQLFSSVFSKTEDQAIYQLWRRIDDRFDLNIDSERMLEIVKDAFFVHVVYSRYYTKLLRKVKPKAIFVVCHYERILWPLYYAANELGIPVIELQHGLVCDHKAYNYRDISNVGKRLPNYLFSYGEFWHYYLHLPNCVKAYPVGNPFLESQCKYYVNSIADDRKIVIYSDIWEKNGCILENLAITISNKYFEQGYRVYFKMHPGEYKDWKEKYISLNENKQIKVVCDEVELYELLSMAKHQIGVYSTVLYEAAAFDSNIYILKTEEKYLTYVNPLIENKFAYMIDGFYEFEQIMLSGISLPRKHIEHVWKQNAEQNAHGVLEKIIRDQNDINGRRNIL